MDLCQIKEIIQIIEALATIIAIIIGGVWSYTLFVKKRQRYPRAIIQQKVAHRAITNGKVLLHVATTISNSGDVLLSLECWEIRVQQVLPAPQEILVAIAQRRNPVPEGRSEISWPRIERREYKFPRGVFEVEPGESQEFHHDFILNSDIKTIEVYSYFKNVTKPNREIGWDATTLYDLVDDGSIKALRATEIHTEKGRE